MAFDLSIFTDPPLDGDYLESQLAAAATDQATGFERLMAYYRNELRDAATADSAADASESARPYTQAQEYGLPPRITGLRHDGYGAIFGGTRVADIRRKEVVIENDIGWRVDAMVHYLFGQPIRIESLAADESLRQKIQVALNAALQANGGPHFLQELALFGHVYGFADVLLRSREAGDSGDARPPRDLESAAADVLFELIEADRAVPILAEDDYRRIDYYVQHFRQRCNRLDGDGGEASVMVTEIIGPNAWQRYHDRELVAAGANPLGRIPVVHVQNLPRPFFYEGHSEVERLIPMQDELNTRLSDRANRISFQSFRMYLGKGIESFEDRPIAPGRMWSTDNPDASIQEFGGEGGSPSEDRHVEQVREAMDKISGVPPLAAGLVRDRLGSLTSGAALRVTLAALLAKTAKKRTAYGQAIEQICELTLHHLDAAGALATAPADRRVEVHWPTMLPEDEGQRLNEALLKKQLGVPTGRILRELGYEEEVAGD